MTRVLWIFVFWSLLVSVVSFARDPWMPQGPRSGRALDQVSDTLRQDDGRPFYAFRFPDAYGDDLRNQRFLARRSGVVSAVMFAFPTRPGASWSTGDPKLVVKLWPSGTDSLPVAGGEWVSDTLPCVEYSPFLYNLDSTWRGTQDQFVIVDLSRYALRVDSGQWFHAGYTVVRDSDDDSLAILSDDGNPPTSYASEWYNGRFVLMRDGWGGINFFIRVVLELESEIGNREDVVTASSVILYPAYPNPFNSLTRLTVDVPNSQRLDLRVFDLLGREQTSVIGHLVGAGRHEFLLDATDWPTGVYTVLLRTAATSSATRVLVIR